MQIELTSIEPYDTGISHIGHIKQIIQIQLNLVSHVTLLNK